MSSSTSSSTQTSSETSEINASKFTAQTSPSRGPADEAKDNHRIIEAEYITPEPVPEHTSSQPAAATSEASRSDTVMSDADEECVPGSSIPPAEKTGRVNRKDKRFVTSTKDPRAIAKQDTLQSKKRDAEDVATPPVKGTAKKRAKESYELELPYHTIRAINMPARDEVLPGRAPPAPVAGNFPYGTTEDYHNSMIIHWLDDQEHTYGTTTGLYNQMFPNDKITDEAVRRRHIRSLERLTKKYGAKPIDQIGPIGKNVLRRGKTRAPRLSSVVREVDHLAVTSAPTTPTTSTAPTAQPLGMANRFTTPYDTFRARRKAQQSHDFDKACIVVWKDADNLDFTAIRDKLESEREWSLGLGTIEKYYYQTVDRVYGTLGINDGDNQDAGGDSDDEAGGVEGGAIFAKSRYTLDSPSVAGTVRDDDAPQTESAAAEDVSVPTV